MMNFMIYGFAKRYAKAAYQNKYIRFINFASSAGIAIGVIALIVSLSVMNGFERELKNTLLSVIPDIEFEAVNGKLDNWQATVTTIESQDKVVGAAPYIKLNAMVQKQDSLEAALIHAVDPELEKKTNLIAHYITEGSWLNGQGVVLGKGLAVKLSVSVGDSLELLLPNFSDEGALASPSYIKTNVIGIYELGGQLDHGQLYLDLDTVQKFLGWSEEQSEGVKVTIVDPFEARTLARLIGGKIDDYVYVLDWYRSHGHIYNDIVMVRDIMYLAMVLVMAVACFNLVSSLTMAIQEKYGDIGILKTMGLQPVVVKRIFITMGMFIALKGVAIGVVVGVLLALFLPQIIAGLESTMSFKALDASVYFIDSIPSQIQFSQVLIVTITAIIIAYLACYFPAKKAAKLRPVDLIN